MSTILSTQERETIIENLSNDPFYILPEYVTPNNLKLTKKEKEKINNSLKERAKEKRQEETDNLNNHFHFYDVIKKIETQDIYEKVKKYVEEHHQLKQEDNLSREEGLKRLDEYFKVTDEKQRVLTNSVKESFYNILKYCLIEIEPIIKTQKVFKNSVYEISKKHHILFLECNIFLDDLMTFDFWNECVNEAIDNFFNYPHTSKPYHEDEKAPKVVNTELLEQIRQRFEAMDKKGYQYAFRTEDEFYSFCNVLALYFDNSTFNDIETVQLNPRTKTRIASTLNLIYSKFIKDDLSLKTNKDFFRIVRFLAPYKEKTDDEIYKALTR